MKEISRIAKVLIRNKNKNVIYWNKETTSLYFENNGIFYTLKAIFHLTKDEIFEKHFNNFEHWQEIYKEIEIIITTENLYSHKENSIILNNLKDFTYSFDLFKSDTKLTFEAFDCTLET